MQDTNSPAREVAQGVLVIDDDPTIVGLIQALLRNEGYETTIATTGEEALRLDGETPDLVVAGHIRAWRDRCLARRGSALPSTAPRCR